MVGAYLSKEPNEIAGTTALVRHFRAFMRSSAPQMRDPYDEWQSRTLNKKEAQRKLAFLIDVAINRKAGVPDAFNSELEGRHQADEVLREAWRTVRGDPEIPARTGHFTPPMKRLLKRMIADASAYEQDQLCIQEDQMTTNKSSNAAVMPSFSEYGIVSKDVRQIVTGEGVLPAPLKPLQAALSRLTARLNVDMAQSGETLTRSLEAAMARQDAPKVSPAKDNGPSPN